jgi:hypothetical protein
MNATANDIWYEANQRYLASALSAVRAALERHATSVQDLREAGDPGEPQPAPQEIRGAMPGQPALETLCSTFNLSPFERDLLLLCAGMEMDSTFAALCDSAQGDARRAYPTFGLALAAMPDSHWSALTPAAPLRYWRLVEVGTGDALTTSPLRIDERVLHYLAGVPCLDKRLPGLVEPLSVPTELPPSHRALARQIVGLWSRAEGQSAGPAIQLCGGEEAAKHAVSAAAAATLGLRLYAIRAADVPAAAGEREAFAVLWEREALLSGGALLLDCQDLKGTDALGPALSLLERLRCRLVVTGREPLRARRRQLVRLDASKPSAAEQQELWRSALGPLANELNGQIETVTAQFNLDAREIGDASVEVLDGLSRGHGGDPGAALWEASRARSRPRLDDLAQRIEPAARWDDLVLPAAQLQTLREIAAHVRRRLKVYEDWGFAAKGTRGLGISALFAGASGTGKTMAAEVLAAELRLDLYRIDLSQVVSKYIGETEKNLRRVFDAAEGGGAILLFDEADALFGKRSEVKDSHDRYANIEVSYLLQRMETYRGLAILTTNMKSALDTAFLRRIRFVVQFPFPDAEQRAEIWRRIFPSRTPTEGLDVEKLARLNVAGGNIRNIALNAAFLAADAEEPVRMGHLLRAARSEYAKLDKSLSGAEVGGWG